MFHRRTAPNAKLSIHQLGRTKTGIASTAVIWGLLEASILTVAAYLTSPASVIFIPDNFTLTNKYIGTIWLIALLLSAGLAAFMGYLLQEERTGFLGLLTSHAIAFSLLAWMFVQFPLANDTQGFYGFVAFAPSFVAGMVILVFFLGSLGVLAGAILRDQTVPEWKVRLDWRFLVGGLLMEAIVVFWPLTAPYPQGYVQGSVNFEWVIPIRLADLAEPIMAVLVGLGMSLALLGFRRSFSTSFTALPMMIGSVVVGMCGIVSHGYTSFIYDYFAPYSGPIAAAQTQAFLTMDWLVVFGMVVPTIIFLGLINAKKIRQPASSP